MDYMLDPPDYYDDEYPFVDDEDYENDNFDEDLIAANRASQWENERDFS